MEAGAEQCGSGGRGRGDDPGHRITRFRGVPAGRARRPAVRTVSPFTGEAAVYSEGGREAAGQVGDEGWFALKTIPSSWNGADGLAGFLGKPSGFCQRSSAARVRDTKMTDRGVSFFCVPILKVCNTVDKKAPCQTP